MKGLKIMALLAALAAFPVFAAEPVDINRADAETLAEALHNVGPVKAEAIVDYREANGGFESIEALANVKGLGLSTIEDNRDVMTVGDTGPQGTR